MITVLATTASMSQYQPLIMLGLIIIIMWFFIFRPQQKKQKEIQKM
ncbi:MAG: preprotein translocase subunit YajC, partial [Bacteroidaceae bacterium]